MKIIAIHHGRAYIDQCSVVCTKPAISDWQPHRRATAAWATAMSCGTRILLPDCADEAFRCVRWRMGDPKYGPTRWTRLVSAALSHDFDDTGHQHVYWTTYASSEDDLSHRVAPRIDDAPERIFCHRTFSADHSKLFALTLGWRVAIRPEWLDAFEDCGCVVRCGEHVRGECWLREVWKP